MVLHSKQTNIFRHEKDFPKAQNLGAAAPSPRSRRHWQVRSADLQAVKWPSSVSVS